MAQNRIALLDETTANQIAAGEVVERPASALKELAENAIDAAATQIVATLEEGGKHKIIVSDNGSGMTRDDAIMALQRHATSKIRTADDLFAIRTMGFRGEALPSIASVSRFLMTTRPHDEESGTRILVVGGEIQRIEEVACREGTTFEISELFFNTPARLKFLKSTPTESSRALELFGHLAIANPQIAFKLRQQTHEVLATPGTCEPLNALAAIWGREIAKKLIPISFDSPGLKVTGHVATPDFTKTGRTHELFFVNRRPIKSRLLNHALEDAFRSLTPDSRFPIAAIFVEVQPDLVDVNVHPTKTEVKFTRDGEIHHAVSQAVKQALLAYGIVPTAKMTPFSPAEPAVEMQQSFNLGNSQSSSNDEASRNGSLISRADAPGDQESTAHIGAALAAFADFIPGSAPNHDFNSQRTSPAVDFNPVPGTLDADPNVRHSTNDADSLTDPPRPKPFAEQLREFKVIGQARNTYIIALTPDGIAIIDQHVAHERVLYERLTVKRFSNGIPVQRLMVPITVNLSRRDALLLSEQLAGFAASGWEISPFGGESFVVRSVPAMLVNKPYEQILRDMIDDLVNQTVSRRLLVQQEHVTITNACKMAVKAGDPLSIEEMTGLLEQLAETENPYLCPHGRPIVVKIGFREIDKQFKR